MSTHTPGPWKVSALDARTIGPSRLLVCADSGGEVPQLQGVAIVTLRTGETEANARVIAAAPELLAALKAAEADLDAALHGRRPPMHPLELGKLYRAAIVKAEGR
jgi:citrate lyase beta subunit